MEFFWVIFSEPNPHMGHLAWADAFVVTADSVSMLSEACGTGYGLSRTTSKVLLMFGVSMFPTWVIVFHLILFLQEACVCYWNGALYMEVCGVP